MSFVFQPRYYQQEAPKQLYNFIKHKRGNPIIALPTASGKSVTIALCIKFLVEMYPMLRFIVAAHSKELVEQNAAKMQYICPFVSMGINSDGLNRRDTYQQVIVGSIGSLLPMVEKLGPRDIIFIDECHRLGKEENAQYKRFYKAIKKQTAHEPYAVGLSATAYDNYGSIVRYDEEGNCTTFFSEICYDKTKPEDFAEFIANGWLCRIISKTTKTRYDIKNVGLVQGEYNQTQLQEAVDVDEKTQQAVAEMILMAKLADRHCGLVFGAGIKHAEHLAEELQRQGEEAVCVHSKISPTKRDEYIEAFEKGWVKWMTNNGVLTTGYDFPPIDILAIVRHTLSIPLYVQMGGRGMRPYDYRNPGEVDPEAFPYIKKDCLLLDFSDNCSRLGFLDSPFFKARKTKKEPGDAPIRICPICEVYNYASARFCSCCGEEFIVETKYNNTAAIASPMSSVAMGEPEPETEYGWKNVLFTNYESFQKTGSAPMLRVIYHCGPGSKYSEVVCIEHKTRARDWAALWWKERSSMPMPSFVSDALEISRRGELKHPKRIRVETAHYKDKHPKVVGHEF